MDIKLDRELTRLDRFVLKVTELLEECGNYVVVSGYVAIGLGRVRGTEDIDLLFEGDFSCLDDKLKGAGLYCINGDGTAECLARGVVPRVAAEGQVVPNAEIKPPKTAAGRQALGGKVRLKVGGASVWISPLELQIAYKIWLGSEKDVEDAVFIYEYLKEQVSLAKVIELAGQIGVKNAEKKVREILG